jgi:hypothetical protein
VADDPSVEVGKQLAELTTSMIRVESSSRSCRRSGLDDPSNENQAAPEG